MQSDTKLKLKKFFLYLPIVVLALIIIVFIVQVVYFSLIIKKGANNDASLFEALTNQEQQHISVEGNYALGASNPTITIVEFSDFACPYCKNLYPTLRELLGTYPGEIKLVYKDFPVANDEWSIPFSLAARCAGEQGAFWDMHDALFAKQGFASPDNLVELAGSLNLETKQFSQCLETEKYFKNIQNDARQGEALGVKNTPTIFINGYMLTGDIPKDILNQLIAEMMAANNK